MAIHVKLCCCYTHGASKKNHTICSDHVRPCFRFVTRDLLRSFVSPKSAGMPGSGCKSDLPSLCFSVTFSVTWTVSSTRDVLGKPAEPGKILKNAHFRNHKIQLSRHVWSVSLLRPHSGRHTETAIINNYFVFQDLEFPFFSIFLHLLSNPSKSIEFVEKCTSEVGKCRNSWDNSFSHILFLWSSLKSNQSNFQLHWSKRRVVSSIQTYPSKKPSVGSAYGTRADLILDSKPWFWTAKF